jgi:CDP-diglyceride synthetase
MIENQIDIILIIRITNIVLALTCIVMWVMFYKNKKEVGAFAPISWLFNFLAFSTWRFINPDYSIETLITASWWTALLCTHAIVLLLISGLMSNPESKLKNDKEKIEYEMEKRINKYMKEEREK